MRIVTLIYAGLIARQLRTRLKLLGKRRMLKAAGIKLALALASVGP